MGKRADEIKILTSDRGAQRLAAILDEVEARLDVCCPPDDDAAKAKSSAAKKKDPPAEK
jgi:hypothetical protein